MPLEFKSDPVFTAIAQKLPRFDSTEAMQEYATLMVLGKKLCPCNFLRLEVCPQ